MNFSRKARLGGVAVIAAASLVLTACGSGSSDSATTDAVITTNGTEPQNPLVPQNTNETGGGDIIDMLFAGLVSYAKDGSQQMEVADSITSSDSKVWTVKLKDWKFSDGTPVTASSFVKAWEYGADPANEALGAYFYYPIVGTDDSGASTTGATLSGLKVIDDKTFTITLKQAESDFPLRLGYAAYYPLPDSAYTDMKAFGEKPVGDGPYKLTKWTHNVEADLVPNANYDGNRVAKNAGLKFKFYTSYDAAYSDLQAGNLDVIDQVPSSALSTYKTDKSIQPFNEPGSVFQSFTIPENMAGFGQNQAGNLRRQAISMAIDRKQITEKIFSGSRTPAKDFSSPLMPGWTDKIQGDSVLSFDPAKAKQLWAQAQAIEPYNGTFGIAYNSDGDHQAWVEAVVNQLKNNLGINAVPVPYPTFKELRTKVTDHSINSAFRTGWQPDYPSIGNYLGPLYGTDAGSNDGGYSNLKFDALLSKAAAAQSNSDRYNDWAEAQGILMTDLPAIPLWNSNITAAAALGVKNVQFNWQNRPILQNVTK